MNPDIIILTGEKQSGKTSFLLECCRFNSSLAGILSPVVQGKRMFYVPAKQQYIKMEAETNEPAFTVGKYRFSQAGFAAATTVLLHPSAGCQYLLVDEIGPLELEQKKGLYPYLQFVLQTKLPYTVLFVCRKSLAPLLAAECLNAGKHLQYLHFPVALP